MPALTQLAVRRLAPHRWELTEPFIYRGLWQTFTVPAGFVTDFASVPQLVQSAIPRTGTSDEAAVLHDWHCKELRAAYDAGARRFVSSVDADGLFWLMLREGGTGPVRAHLMWTGVRWGAARNPARRADWWHTAPAVLATSAGVALAALALLLPFVLGAVLFLLLAFS